MSTMRDIEMGPIDEANKASTYGYAAAAGFIARDADSEVFIFRKFGNLAARRLLYLEAELIELEEEQRRLDDEVRHGDSELQYSMEKYENLVKNASDNRVPEKLRVDQAKEIDQKLGKYYRALALQRKIFQFERPTRSAIKAFRIEILGERPKIRGNARHMVDDEGDLIALNSAIDKDALSMFLKNHWLFPTKILSSNEQGQVTYFTRHSLDWFVNICSVAIAAILLIGPIVALYFVSNPDARLSLVIIFLVLFAIGLSISTGCSRDNLFAATAAYAAVLVVFVSGNLGQARSGVTGP